MKPPRYSIGLQCWRNGAPVYAILIAGEPDMTPDQAEAWLVAELLANPAMEVTLLEDHAT